MGGGKRPNDDRHGMDQAVHAHREQEHGASRRHLRVSQEGRPGGCGGGVGSDVREEGELTMSIKGLVLDTHFLLGATCWPIIRWLPGSRSSQRGVPGDSPDPNSQHPWAATFCFPRVHHRRRLQPRNVVSRVREDGLTHLGATRPLKLPKRRPPQRGVSGGGSLSPRGSPGERQ